MRFVITLSIVAWNRREVKSFEVDRRLKDLLGYKYQVHYYFKHTEFRKSSRPRPNERAQVLLLDRSLDSLLCRAPDPFQQLSKLLSTSLRDPSTFHPASPPCDVHFGRTPPNY